MSTTPGTSSPAPISYTVIGGRRWDRIRKYASPLTFVVLSRGDRLYREALLRDLLAMGAGDVLWVGGPEVSPDLESDARAFPDVRFMVLSAPASPGERLSIGISEARSPLALCLWSDARVASMAPALLARMEADPCLCLVPLVRGARSEAIPSLQSPRLRRGRLELTWRVPAGDGERTLYPFDYCGLYQVDRFSRVGGYCANITNPHWQKLDFGFRANLWGETIRCAVSLAVSYAGAPPAEDVTADASYKAFWLRNLAVQVKGDGAVLPGWRVAEYMLRSDTGPLYAVREFRAAQEWVNTNRLRYRLDPRAMIAGWEKA